MIRRPRRSTLFPYTSLCRSRVEPLADRLRRVVVALEERQPVDVADVRHRRRLEVDVVRVAVLALPAAGEAADDVLDRKSTRLNSSYANISYAVFCLEKKYTR